MSLFIRGKIDRKLSLIPNHWAFPAYVINTGFKAEQECTFISNAVPVKLIAASCSIYLSLGFLWNLKWFCRWSIMRGEKGALEATVCVTWLNKMKQLPSAAHDISVSCRGDLWPLVWLIPRLSFSTYNWQKGESQIWVCACLCLSVCLRVCVLKYKYISPAASLTQF